MDFALCIYQSKSQALKYTKKSIGNMPPQLNWKSNRLVIGRFPVRSRAVAFCMNNAEHFLIQASALRGWAHPLGMQFNGRTGVHMNWRVVGGSNPSIPIMPATLVKSRRSAHTEGKQQRLCWLWEIQLCKLYETHGRQGSTPCLGATPAKVYLPKSIQRTRC